MLLRRRLIRILRRTRARVRPSRAYKYARKRIPCACPRCSCPARAAGRYSFVYVSEPLRLIYYDVPKCASTTIRNVLFQNDNALSLADPRNERSSYFSFTFVRNPWSRMVSNWKMFTTQSARIRQLKSMTDEDLSRFDDFVDFAIRVPNHHWQPQVLFLPEPVDFVGRVENFEADFCRVLERHGLENPVTESLNVTDHKPYSAYYTDGLVDKVADFYAEDIRTFGYEFKRRV